MKLIIFILVFLFFWALVHGGTRNGQSTTVYDDDHDVSGLLEED